MTLVGFDENSNELSIMLGVQQQLMHHRHHGLYATGSGHVHRGNVIVSTGINGGQDVKIVLQQQPQHQSQNQQPQAVKRKMYQQSATYSSVPVQPASVARRNARERNRVKQVNNGFATLRQHIPQTLAQALGGNTAGTHGGARAGSKKLSKVETLRMAVEYIRNLQRMLEEDNAYGNGSPTSSGSLSPKIELNDDSDGYKLCESGDETSDLSELQDAGHQHHQYHHHHQHLGRQDASPIYVPAPCSEASSSPTPSFVSEASSAGSQGYVTNSSVMYTPPSDAYENYDDPMNASPDVLLNSLQWWSDQ